MRIFKSLFLSLLTLTAVSACGNINAQPDQLMSQTNGVSSQSSVDSYLPASQRCSLNPNVVGNDGALNHEYRACSTATTTIGTIALYPSDTQSKGVCVFPIRLSQTGQASAVISNPNNPLATRYVYQCVHMQTTGATVSFPGLSFGAVYVVDAANAPILSACIATGDVGTCAAADNLTLSYGELSF